MQESYGIYVNNNVNLPFIQYILIPYIIRVFIRRHDARIMIATAISALRLTALAFFVEILSIGSVIWMYEFVADHGCKF